MKIRDCVILYRSLAACENKHKILLECYKTSWVGGCQNEMEDFWKCVNDNKVFVYKNRYICVHEIILDTLALPCKLSSQDSLTGFIKNCKDITV